MRTRICAMPWKGRGSHTRSTRPWRLRGPSAPRHAVRFAGRWLLIVGRRADRWGRVCPEGTVLRIPGLNHEMLASAVGARRSPVTKALGELKRRGMLEIRPGGEILVRDRASTPA